MADECTNNNNKQDTSMQRRMSFVINSASITATSEQKTRRVTVAVNGNDGRHRHHHGHSSLSSSSTSSMHSYENYRVTSRNHRRMHRTTDDNFNCSQQSILTAMDRFVKTVQNMNATILVPSRLRDMDITGQNVRNIPQPLASTDLYSFYMMLNDVKKELLWGPGTSVASVSTIVQPLTGERYNREIKHVRQPSDDSLGSLGSTASSSDPETDSDVDSLLTDRDSVDEPSSHLAAAFRHHLQGLHTILHQLADSAEYLLMRYQEDVESGSH